jgi:hypothetical protein
MPSQPTITEKDIGAKKLESWAVSGFCYTIFKVKYKRHYLQVTILGRG